MSFCAAIETLARILRTLIVAAAAKRAVGFTVGAAPTGLAAVAGAVLVARRCATAPKVVAAVLRAEAVANLIAARRAVAEALALTGIAPVPDLALVGRVVQAANTPTGTVTHDRAAGLQRTANERNVSNAVQQ